MTKIIQDFNIDLSSIAAAGAVRDFQVVGDSGAIFSLEVKNEDGYYYNFTTKTFAATHKRLKNRKVNNGVYNGSITFPTVGDPDQYDIFLFAESMHGTTHTDYSEVRFGDGSIDINSSVGSNSNLLKKVIYQYDDVTVTLSAISPSASHHSTGNFVSMVVATDSIVIGRGNTIGKTAFSIGVTAAATKALQITRQPTINDLTAYASVTMGDGVLIHGEDIWSEARRSSDTTNGAVSGGETVTMDTAVATKMKVGDRVEGTGIPTTSVVTVTNLSGTYTFDTSEVVTIGDGVTLEFTPPYYYRWGINSSSSIHKLTPGMTLVDSDATITSSTIGPYQDTTTYTTEIYNEDGSIEEVTNTVVNASALALDPLGYKPTITNGVVTKQLGYITFNDKIINDLKTQACFFYGYGPTAIKSIHDTTIKLTDLKVELTAPTTTVTSDSSDTTIPVADREGVINNISTISGIGIDASVANPVITSGGGTDGAGDWTIGVSPVLAQNTVLTVGNTSRVATITGNIEFVNVDDASFSLYFNVERFLSAT